MNKIVELELRSTIESGPIVLRAKELKQLLAVVRAAQAFKVAYEDHDSDTYWIEADKINEALAALEKE